MPSHAEHKTPSGSRKVAIRLVKERKMQKKRDLSFSFQKMSLSLHPHLRPNAPLAPLGAEWKGKMAEWSIAAVLKTVDLKGFGGSNPSLSAKTDGRLGNPGLPLFY